MTSSSEWLRSLDQAATTRPWVSREFAPGMSTIDGPSQEWMPSDSEMIVALRNLLPELADVVEAVSDMFPDKGWLGEPQQKLWDAYRRLTDAVNRERGPVP